MVGNVPIACSPFPPAESQFFLTEEDFPDVFPLKTLSRFTSPNPTHIALGSKHPPERKLISAILISACHDIYKLRKDTLKGFPEGKGYYDKQNAEKAMEWILEDNDNFVDDCIFRETDHRFAYYPFRSKVRKSFTFNGCCGVLGIPAPKLRSLILSENSSFWGEIARGARNEYGTRCKAGNNQRAARACHLEQSQKGLHPA